MAVTITGDAMNLLLNLCKPGKVKTTTAAIIMLLCFPVGEFFVPLRDAITVVALTAETFVFIHAAVAIARRIGLIEPNPSPSPSPKPKGKATRKMELPAPDPKDLDAARMDKIMDAIENGDPNHEKLLAEWMEDFNGRVG